MRLAHALRLADGDIVALTGAGGKSAALFRLADDVVERGGRVITTVTTHLGLNQLARAPRHFSAFEANRAAVAAALARQAHVLVTGPLDRAQGRAAGVTAGLVADLHQIPDLQAIVVEADGSRQLPFKAPAAHEPAIPECATVVLTVAGLSVLGRPLTAEHVHRPERVAALAGAPLGAPVTPEIMARVLAHPDGGGKGVPAGARWNILLNQCESETDLAAGRWVADYLLQHAPVEAVLLGQARRPNAVREVQARAAAVVLAAGRSTRMGQSKQLLPWGATTILGAVVRALRPTPLAEIVVVTGAERERVEAALAAEQAADPRVRLVFNPDFAAGEMAASLQAGLRALPAACQGALVALGDQPWLEPAVVEAVLERWRATLDPALAPAFEGQRGHPLLFDRAAWPAVLALPAEANPRAALAALGPPTLVAVSSAGILRDLDTPADYAAARPDDV